MKTMNSDAKISIIGIGYNAENYIRTFLNDALSINDNNYEVIFVNDGSVDNTDAIVKEYINDPHLIYIKKDNGGIVSARQAGLVQATGQYVLMADSDDILGQDILMIFRRLLNKYNNEDPDIIITDTWTQRNANSEFFRLKSKINYGLFSKGEYLQAVMSDQILHFMFSKLYKRDFMLKAGYLDYPHVTMAEDWMTQIFFGTYSPTVVYADDTTYYYKYNDTSLSRSENNNVFRQYDTFCYIEKYFKRKNIYNKYREYIDYIWYSYVKYYLSFPYSYTFKKEIINKSRIKLHDLKNNNIIKKQDYRIVPSFSDIIFKLYYDNSPFTFVVDKLIFLLLKIKNHFS